MFDMSEQLCYFERGRNDGYQDTVNTYLYAISADYSRGVKEGRALRRRIRGKLTDANGRVTFDSIIGFMKRQTHRR